MTALSQPAISLLDFLDQFLNVDSRWPNLYNWFTFDIIRQCAIFQTTLCYRRPLLSADSSSDSVLIALSLRCLVLMHEISLVRGQTPYSIFKNESHYRSEKCHEQDPSVEVSKSLTASQTSFADSKQEESLLSMLEEIIQTTQRLLFRRKPADWPLLL